jgi:hypothetical protein
VGELELLKDAPPQYNYDMGCWQEESGEFDSLKEM